MPDYIVTFAIMGGLVVSMVLTARRSKKRENSGKVVRCKDCKSYKQLGETVHSFVCVNAYGLRLAKSDSYCPYGERRTDGK